MYPLQDYPNYAITRSGQVYSKSKSRDFDVCLKQVLDKGTGYYIVTLYAYPKPRKNQFVHRLLAQTFIPNPDNKPQVNHIDGNKMNNTLSNLEWVTSAENTQHAVDLGLITFDYCEKPIIQVCKSTGKDLATFKSGREAHRQTGIAFQNISKVLTGKRKSAGGYEWKYKI